MKILQIISAPAAGGAEVYVKDLAKALVRSGHEVDVGFLGHAQDIGRSQEYEKAFLDELKKHNVQYFFIGNECRKKPWLGVVRIRKYIKNRGIDIYHAHLPFAVVFSMGISVPTVYTHHSIKPRLNSIVYKIFNKLVDRYIGISKVCAKKLSEYSGRKVTAIVNGVDAEKITTKVRKPEFGVKTRAISVGRIHPHKGYFFLADVVKSLPETLRERFHVSIAGEGDGDYSKELNEYLRKNDIEDNFEFLGNRSDIPDLLSEADLFLMSSEQEGLPISLIEAAVSGLPCVVTDVGGCREIIELCHNGIAVPYGDTKEYASIIKNLIENPNQLRMYSEKAVENACLLGIESVSHQHIDVYKELLEK